MTHTPGPYSYRPHSYDDWGVVRDSNGLLVCLARGGRNLTQKEIDEYRSNGTDPYEDNAHLFAAAPDMLAALKYNLMILYDAHPEPEQRRYALALTLEAIAKAEGRAVHAWDQMCKAGYAAREVLKRIDEQEEPR